MYADFFDAELIATQRAMSSVLVNHEKRLASLLFNTGTWTPTSVTHEWDDATNRKPVDDVEARVQSRRKDPERAPLKARFWCRSNQSRKGL